MSSYGGFNDIELVLLLNKSDHSAYTEIYERYFPLLYFHARKKVNDKEDARDLVQDVFISLWNRRQFIEPKPEIIPYLYTALRNKIIDWMSRQEVSSRFVSHFKRFYETSECITDHKVRESQLLALIENEIGALPPRMREIFELRRKEHLSHREIALHLSLSEQTVKTQVKHALRILRTKLGLVAYLVMLFHFRS